MELTSGVDTVHRKCLLGVLKLTLAAGIGQPRHSQFGTDTRHDSTRLKCKRTKNAAEITATSNNNQRHKHDVQWGRQAGERRQIEDDNNNIVHYPQPWFAGRYVAVSDQKCRETAPAPYHICSVTFTNDSRKFGGPCPYTFWPADDSCWVVREDTRKWRCNRLVVEISGDLAGTSFGRQVDSGPSSCKTRVVKNVCNRLRLSCT
eukprot:scaffold74643_cov60-Attheya_sp.AAC.1